MTRRNFKLFRALTSTIFIYAGTNHLFHSEKILNKVSKSTFYEWLSFPALFTSSILISGLAMVVGGILLAIGFRQKWSALLLLLILIPISLAVQLENLQDLGPFFKNVAIAGSLLFIINYKTHEVQNRIIGTGSAINSDGGVFAGDRGRAEG